MSNNNNETAKTISEINEDFELRLINAVEVKSYLTANNYKAYLQRNGIEGQIETHLQLYITDTTFEENPTFEISFAPFDEEIYVCSNFLEDSIENASIRLFKALRSFCIKQKDSSDNPLSFQFVINSF